MGKLIFLLEQFSVEFVFVAYHLLNPIRSTFNFDSFFPVFILTCLCPISTLMKWTTTAITLSHDFCKWILVFKWYAVGEHGENVERRNVMPVMISVSATYLPCWQLGGFPCSFFLERCLDLLPQNSAFNLTCFCSFVAPSRLCTGTFKE